MNEFMREAVSLYKIGQEIVDNGSEAVCNKIEKAATDHTRLGRIMFRGDLDIDNKPNKLRYLPTGTVTDGHAVMVYENWVIDPIGNYLCDIDVYTSLLCKWNDGSVLIDRTCSYLGTFLLNKYASAIDVFVQYIRIINKEV